MRTAADRLGDNTLPWRIACTAVLWLFLVEGCGIESYEKQMANEQKKLEKFDNFVAEEEKYLGEPLEMPPTIPVTKQRGSERRRRFSDGRVLR